MTLIASMSRKQLPQGIKQSSISQRNLNFFSCRESKALKNQDTIHFHTVKNLNAKAQNAKNLQVCSFHLLNKEFRATAENYNIRKHSNYNSVNLLRVLYYYYFTTIPEAACFSSENRLIASIITKKHPTNPVSTKLSAQNDQKKEEPTSVTIILKVKTKIF